MDTELTPCFLVAAPSLACPFFNHTVVLLVDHRDDGSLGFVINRPSELRLGEILTQIGIPTIDEVPTNDLVMMGGPVAPETGWLVFDPVEGDLPDDGVLHVHDRLAVSANPEMLERIARGDGPPAHLMMLGYAGWGPGQLDHEIREGSWIVVDLDPSLVFDLPADERWIAALAKLGIDPARVVGTSVAEA